MFYNNNNIISRPPGPSCLKVDSAIQCINLYPVDSTIGFPNSYPVDTAVQCLNNWGQISQMTGSWISQSEQFVEIRFVKHWTNSI